MTWQPSKSATSGFDWTSTRISNWDHLVIAVGPDGVVHIASYASNESQIAYGRSIDGGDTFVWDILTATANLGSDYVIPLSQQNPNLIFVTVQILSLAVGPNGALAIGWCMNESANPGPPLQVFVAQCTDNGVGWSQGAGLAGPAQTSALLPLSGLPTNLPGAATDYYSKPKLVYAPDGSLGCFANHYGSQNSPPMDGYLWVAPSGGGGLFTAATLVVSQAFDPLLRPIQRWNLANTLYFGDFIGLAASNLGFFPYWSDTRGGSAQLFVSRLALNPADAYLRHFASDNGTLGAPRAGESYFDSPDLVVRLQQDGTVNFANQPVNTNNPQDLYVYGRVWNNGPNPANPISLSAALSTFGPTTVWLYPHDWYEADWGAADQATHTWLGSVSTPGPLAVGQSVILGPIVIPQSAFNWASFGHPCILAKVDVDNDDSNGGAPYGCAIPAVGGVCFEQAFFWGTNNACQLNISYVTLQTGGAAFGPLRFGAGNPLSSLESLGVVFERTGALQDIPFRLRLLNPDDVIAEIPPAAMKRSEWGLADARAILRLLIRRGARLEFELHGEPLETIEGGHAGAIRVSQVTLGGKFQGGVEFAVGFTQKRP